MRPSDPFAVLGLPAGATADEINGARRRLARERHPDVGGSVEAMQQLNRAVAEALALATPTERTEPRPRRTEGHPRRERRHAQRSDHPSFTIEALPAVAFEGLLIVASTLGTPIDDDPPYLLEVALDDPVRGWCAVELVPDAGASTVSLHVAPEPGRVAPDLDTVRNAWIEGLNRLDWSDLDPPQPS